MDLNLQVYVDGMKNSIQLKDASDGLAEKAIGQFLQAMQPVAAPEKKPVPIEPSITLPPISDEDIKRVTTTGLKEMFQEVSEPKWAESEVQSDPVKAKTVQETSRKLPLSGQETRSQFPMSELLKQEEPAHWKTGIKVDEDGTQRYKCRCHCDCGAKQSYYIPLGQEFVTCRDCGEDAFVEPAVFGMSEGQEPKRDTFGNFFVAGKLAS